MKVTELTKDQELRMAEFRDKWINIGLSTEPANRAEAERGIRIAYEIAGLKPPEKIVWCGSPLSQGLASAIVLGLSKGDIEIAGASVRASVWASVGDSVGASVGASVRDSVWASVGDSVGDSVWDSVRDSVWASVGDSVWASVGASVRDSVWASVGDSVWASVGASVRDSVWDSVGASVGASVRDSVWASVGDSVGDSVWDSVRASVRDSVWASVWASVGASVRDSVWASVGDSVWDSGYGQHDANWLAFYEYFAEVCDLGREAQKLTGLWLIAKHAGWFLPHEKICWVSERHNVLHRDDRGRLHCDDGPALSYPDGWSIYSVHGVRVPAWIIESPETITVEKIEAEQNTEIRRVMTERYGLERYIKDSGAVKAHTDDWGTLWRKEIPGDEPIVMVEVLNSTPEPDGTFKTYFLRVPPDQTTAKGAIAWTFGKTEEEYAPLIET